MEKIWEILLSGTISALIATLLSVWYQYRSEQIKDRTDVIMAVVDWMDNICAHLLSLQINKERCYTGQSPSLLKEEGRSMNNDMRILLLSDRITTQVVCVFGEGNILQKINALKGELTKAAEILWAAKPDTWPNSEKEIMKILKEKIDPIKASVMKDFFHSAGKISILRREQMTSRIKKIIAREGLIILLYIFFLVTMVLIIPNIVVLKDTKQPIDLLTQEEHKIINDEKKITYTVVLKKGENFLKEFNTEGKIDEFVNKNGNVKKIELDTSDLKKNL